METKRIYFVLTQFWYDKVRNGEKLCEYRNLVQFWERQLGASGACVKGAAYCRDYAEGEVEAVFRPPYSRIGSNDCPDIVRPVWRIDTGKLLPEHENLPEYAGFANIKLFRVHFGKEVAK